MAGKKTIIVAAGFESRDHWGEAVVKMLNEDAEPGKGSVWTFPKGATGGKITHEVRVVYTQAEFAAALDMAEAYVVYDGHSRYGQGPQFGPPRPGSMPWGNGQTWVPDKKDMPINPWGVHFRMGYDATDTECMRDLVLHSIVPDEYDLTALPAKPFLPKSLITAAADVETTSKAIAKSKPALAKACSTDGAWRSFTDCYPKLDATTTTRGDQPLKGRHYFQQDPKPRKWAPSGEFMTAVKVGSVDLDKVSLKCQVLFMSACSSHVHYYEALDRRRKAVKSKCTFLMMADLCSAFSAKNFVKEMFGGLDPGTPKGATAMAKKLDGEDGSGGIDVY